MTMGVSRRWELRECSSQKAGMLLRRVCVIVHERSKAVCILCGRRSFPGQTADDAIRRNTLRREDGVSSKRNALPTSVRTSRPLRRERVGCGNPPEHKGMWNGSSMTAWKDGQSHDSVAKQADASDLKSDGCSKIIREGSTPSTITTRGCSAVG